jgi:transposase
LTQIVRRGRGGSVRVRRAAIIMALSSGMPVSAVARLVAADEDTVRDVIHAFNERGLAAVDPRWAGGRPRLISGDDITFIVTTASTRPAALGMPFTQWSVRKLAAYVGAHGHADGRARRVHSDANADGERPNRRAMARTLSQAARKTLISSRSENDNRNVRAADSG